MKGWSGSDVDLFFLYDGDDDADRFPWITFTRLAACLVDATEAMGFPPFSGDGRYLEVLYVREMERVLGSPDDDSTNAFTARMLLLLESQPVYDPSSTPLFLNASSASTTATSPTTLKTSSPAFWSTTSCGSGAP